jgi:two-component system C4-dicarboxylate transport response regulator DctD
MLIRSVLLVDDDDDWRALMAELLAEAGLSVTTASDGRDALQSWRRTRAEVVVTDVEMPRMNGCELLAALHSIDSNLPGIVLTAEDLSGAAPSCAGAFRVIRKPALTDAVVSAVSDALLERRPPRRRRVANAARAIAYSGGAKGQAAISRALSFLRPAKSGERSVVRKRRRAGLAAAGVGAAAALAILIAAIRGMTV